MLRMIQGLQLYKTSNVDSIYLQSCGQQCKINPENYLVRRLDYIKSHLLTKLACSSVFIFILTLLVVLLQIQFSIVNVLHTHTTKKNTTSSSIDRIIDIEHLYRCMYLCCCIAMHQKRKETRKTYYGIMIGRNTRVLDLSSQSFLRVLVFPARQTTVYSSLRLLSK